MRRLIILFCCVGILLLTGCALTPEIQAGSSERQCELDFLYTTLEKNHVDLYHATNKKAFDRAYRKARKEIDSLDDVEYHFTLKKLVALAMDSHTAISLPQSLATHLYAIPVQMQYIQDAWRLIVVPGEQETLLGFAVQAINGKPMTEIEEEAGKLYSSDNLVWKRHALAQQLNLTNLYSYLGFAENPTKAVTLNLVSGKTGQAVSLVLDPVCATDYAGLEFATVYEKNPPTGMSGKPYSALVLQEGKTLFIQYNVCASFEQFTLANFQKAVIRLLCQSSFETVILDLRYNGGGDSRLFEPLINAIGELKKTQDFNVYVLIGEATFSSALMNAVQCKQRFDCKLVGTPTGGSVNHYGEMESFELPLSNSTVFYSTQHFVMDPKQGIESLKPDLYIPNTVSDLLNGIDTVVEAVLKL